jgi:hypothetical protein
MASYGPGVDCDEYLKRLKTLTELPKRNLEQEATLRGAHKRCVEYYMEQRRKEQAEREAREEQDRQAVDAADSGRPTQGLQGSKSPWLADWMREEAEREEIENSMPMETDSESASDEAEVLPPNSRRYARQVAIDEAIRGLEFVRNNAEAMRTSADVRAQAARDLITYIQNPENTRGVSPSVVRAILERMATYENAARTHTETMASVEDRARDAEQAVRKEYKQFKTWVKSMSHLTTSALSEFDEIVAQYPGEPYDSDGSDASNA